MNVSREWLHVYTYAVKTHKCEYAYQYITVLVLLTATAGIASPQDELASGLTHYIQIKDAENEGLTIHVTGTHNI